MTDDERTDGDGDRSDRDERNESDPDRDERNESDPDRDERNESDNDVAADPFADLDEHADREGDPFEHLGGPDEVVSDEGAPDSGASAERAPDPGAPGEAVSDPGASANAPTDGRADEASDIFGEPEDSGPDSAGSEAWGDAETGEPDPFEYMGDDGFDGPDAPGTAPESGQAPAAGDTGEPPAAGDTGEPPAAGDGVAEPLSDVESPGEDPFDSPGSPFEQVDVGAVDPDAVWDRLTGAAEPEPPEDREDDIVDVSKHSFCEGCEFFSAPPDVHCTHEGTKILEFVDIDNVRVANCPVVAERRELGGLEE